MRIGDGIEMVYKWGEQSATIKQQSKFHGKMCNINNRAERRRPVLLLKIGHYPNQNRKIYKKIAAIWQ